MASLITTVQLTAVLTALILVCACLVSAARCQLHKRKTFHGSVPETKSVPEHRPARFTAATKVAKVSVRQPRRQAETC